VEEGGLGGREGGQQGRRGVLRCAVLCCAMLSPSTPAPRPLHPTPPSTPQTNPRRPPPAPHPLRRVLLVPHAGHQGDDALRRLQQRQPAEHGHHALGVDAEPLRRCGRGAMITGCVFFGGVVCGLWKGSGASTVGVVGWWLEGLFLGSLGVGCGCCVGPILLPLGSIRPQKRAQCDASLQRTLAAPTSCQPPRPTVCRPVALRPPCRLPRLSPPRF